MIFHNCNNKDTFSINNDNNHKQWERKKYLGLILDHKLKFVEYIDYIIKKNITKPIGAMYKSNSLSLKYGKMFVNYLMLPHFDYLDIMWCKALKSKLHELDILYKKTAKIVLNYLNTWESSMT